MKLVAALAILLLAPFGATAQITGSTGTNPPVGSVWTYLGPTFGAGWQPVAAPLPFILQGTITGTKTSGNSPGDYGNIWTWAGLSVTSDTGTNQMTPGAGMPAFSVVHNYGGAGAGEAPRMGLWVNLRQMGAVPLGTGKFHFSSGIFSNVDANFNEGGSSGGAFYGEMYGYAGQVMAGPGATYLYGITGGEIDVAPTSSSLSLVEGWGVGSVPLSYGNPTQHGAYGDQGYGLWAGGTCGAGALAGGSGCGGFNVGLAFGRFDSYFPITSGGTIIATIQGVGTAANMKALQGIDFHNVTFTNYSLNLPGFLVYGTGNVQITANYANINMKDPQVADNNGGRMRLASNGLASYCWQVNTAVAGDYSTSVNSWCTGSTGTFTSYGLAVLNQGSVIGGPATITGGGSPPPLHFYSIYVDPNDNKLKVTASTGTNTVLASP